MVIKYLCSRLGPKTIPFVADDEDSVVAIHFTMILMSLFAAEGVRKLYR